MTDWAAGTAPGHRHKDHQQHAGKSAPTSSHVNSTAVDLQKRGLQHEAESQQRCRRRLLREVNLRAQCRTGVCSYEIGCDAAEASFDLMPDVDRANRARSAKATDLSLRFADNGVGCSATDALFRSKSERDAASTYRFPRTWWYYTVDSVSGLTLASWAVKHA